MTTGEQVSTSVVPLANHPISSWANGRVTVSVRRVSVNIGSSVSSG